MIAEYVRALRNVAVMGRWEAPQEGLALGWLLIRNVEAAVELARRDEVLVTAAWSNARVALELATRIIWMLHPADRYEAECRWLSLLGEYEEIERRLAREVPSYADRQNEKADIIRNFREGIIAALPSGYWVQRKPNFLNMLEALDTPEMYQFTGRARSLFTAAFMPLRAAASISALNAILAISLQRLTGFFLCACAGYLCGEHLGSSWIAWRFQGRPCRTGMS